MTHHNEGDAVTATYALSISKMQQLTRDYASFSQSRSGLGNVLGGVAGLLVFAALLLLGHGVLAAILTLGPTVIWLIGKEIIRRRLYRTFGDSRETWTASQRRGHAIIVSIIGLVLAACAVLFAAYTIAGKASWSTTIPYLIFCLVTPWIAWRYLRTANELMLGCYLLFASAIAVSGHAPDLLLFAAILPLYSLALIWVGLNEHRQFQELATRLQTSDGAGG